MFRNKCSLVVVALICAGCFGLAISEALGKAALDCEAEKLFGGCTSYIMATCGASGTGCITIAPGVTSCCSGRTGFGAGPVYSNQKVSSSAACGGSCGSMPLAIGPCG